MTDLVLLRDAIDKSGLKMQFIAKSIGLSYQGFLNKMKGISQFGNQEILDICLLLHIEESEMIRIFFPKLVDKS